MKHNIKKFLLPAFAVTALSMASCSDWTATEGLDIKYPSLESQNPELYRQYIEALRNYKASEHKVVLTEMRNTLAAPSQRNEHLTTMPDSVDYITLLSPDNLHPTLHKEFDEVRKKGTKVLCNIDYNAIEKRWVEEQAALPEASRADGEEGGEPAPGQPTDEERFLAYCSEQTAALLAVCDKYGYDGLQFCFTGPAPQSMSEEQKAAYAARQQAFLSKIGTWKSANESKTLIFKGTPQNLLDVQLLSSCDYIVIPALNATSVNKMSFAVLMAMVKDVPADRFVIGVTIPSIVDLSNENGYFPDMDTDGKTRVRATKGAAQWAVNQEPGYTKSGISIADAQYDYFNIDLVYKNIREAINIMNPTPKH